jgi:thiol-disulfide isomerase/thioredoxin
MLPALNITVLGEEERECTLQELVAGKVGVIDLWHTKCTKCPAALSKFDADAEKFGNEEVMFIACALSLGEGNKEEVTDLACE